MWVVNGHVEKVDGNFQQEFFVRRIGNTGLFIGSYPNKREDVF